MGAFLSLYTAASGLSAQRTRLDVIANNIANADTTRRGDGKPGPYRRQRVIFEPRENPIRFQIPLVEGSDRNLFDKPGTGVRITKIIENDGPVPYKYLRYEPNHPDANAEGYVEYPDVDIVVEMVDMIDASRAYEANVTTIRDFRQMWQDTLRLGGQ
ncbi:MAG: flagellar basal body rod protein FlgC [Candidatus Hydrogenedentota bacterium]|nr:MAG: flagellar basal body rod protein FlgC [Candidatus Hydrogenedentota bacterium]